jgi:tRNA U34 5-methylaminomethyl-2-thiouridine-forming methyltransferase MnmC
VKFLNPEIVYTKDGSHSLYLAEIDEHYHSHHGAVQESMHVYIDAGLKKAVHQCTPKKLHIFELGFGTGLNALLTAQFANESQVELCFHSIEKYPVEPDALCSLNYGEHLGTEHGSKLFEEIVTAGWEKEVQISPYFFMQKICADFFEYQSPRDYYDVLYFDAFGYRAQSEMWGQTAFARCFRILKPGGILVTYAAKGSARRALETCGFDVERIEGAPGKREMMRATKPLSQ